MFKEKSVFEKSNDALYCRHNNQNNFLYYGLLVYTIVFYSQIAGRFPFLASFRIELIIGSILLITIISRIINGEIDFKENRLNIVIFLFFFSISISTLFAYVHSRAFTTFIKVFKFFAIYPMIIAAIDSKKKLKGFIFVYLTMIGLLFVEPFLLSLQGKGFIYNNHMWRLAGVTGMFKHPNGLGMITASNVPFFYYFMMNSKSKLIKVICFILLFIAFRVIMLTQSRTAFLGLIIFGIMLWIISKKKILAMITGIMVFLALWQLAPEETKARFLTFMETTKVITSQREDLSEYEIIRLGSMDSRWQLMRHTIRAIKENPFMGLGLDCFASYSGRKWGLWLPPHNTYLQVLAELGIIGFFCLMLVIKNTFKNLILAKRLANDLKIQDPFVLAMIFSVTLYYFIYLVVSVFGIEIYSNFWWLSGGLSVVILRIIKIDKKNIL